MTSNFRIIQCLVFMSIICTSVWTADSTLKLINMVFRHGDRNLQLPQESYPTDPYKNYKSDSPGNGVLTRSGRSREYNLGTFLRKAYNDFLGTTYTPGNVKAQSSNVNRTKESLQLVLKALYPEASIPTTFDSVFKDTLFFPHFCPEYAILYLKAKWDSRRELAKLEALGKYLSTWTGKKIKSAHHMYLIYNTLEVERYMNLPLPIWTKSIYPDGALLTGTLLHYKIMNYYTTMRKRNGGMFVRKFTEDMLSVKNGTMDKNRKINLYGGHDTNVVAVLQALGVYKPHFPKFSSAVILELHFIQPNFYVKVVHYLGIPDKIQVLQIPDCKILCPLDQFVSLMKNVIPSGSSLLCSKIRNVNPGDIFKD